MLTTPSRLPGPGGGTIEKRCVDREVMGAGAPRRAEDDEALEGDQPTPPASPPHRAFCLLSIILLPVLRVLNVLFIHFTNGKADLKGGKCLCKDKSAN